MSGFNKTQKKKWSKLRKKMLHIKKMRIRACRYANIKLYAKTTSKKARELCFLVKRIEKMPQGVSRRWNILKLYYSILNLAPELIDQVWTTLLAKAIEFKESDHSEMYEMLEKFTGSCMHKDVDESIRCERCTTYRGATRKYIALPSELSNIVLDYTTANAP
jgi:hypothetical protein